MNTENIFWEPIADSALDSREKYLVAEADEVIRATLFYDIQKAVMKCRQYGVEANTLYVGERAYRLLTGILPMKGTARMRKKIRFRNRKRQPIRDYFQDQRAFNPAPGVITETA